MANIRRKISRSNNGIKFPREQSFFDKSFFIKICAGLVFAAALFSILHFKEIRVDVFELHTDADRFVVSQVNFEFFDDEATSILKQEASRDIGKIYRIEEKEIKKHRSEFENFLVHNKDWRKFAEHSTFEEMYNGAEDLEQALLKLRLTDSRTIQKIQQLKLPSESYAMYVPPEANMNGFLPNRIWEQLKQSAFSNNDFQLGSVDFIVKYFKDNEWKLVEDKIAQRNIRQAVESYVPKQYTKINAGERIIDQGEKISPRHLTMLQAMKRALADKRNLWRFNTITGSSLLTILFIFLAVIYLYYRFPDIFSSNSKLFLLAFILMITFSFAKFTEFFLLATTSNLIDIVRYPLFVPFAAILISALFNIELALFSSAYLVLIFSIAFPFSSGFIILNFVTACVAILSSRTLRNRKEILTTSLKSWLTCSMFLLAFHTYQNTVITQSYWIDNLTTLGFMFMTAILVVGVLPLIEAIFPIMTDAVLVEYLDPNNKLLSRLALEAPGTYQHSIVVSHLAETAANAIGANSLFCRVASLFHDIGKLRNPQYFTENQEKGVSMHQLLTPCESAQVIISHVSEGVAIAHKAGLPEQFIDIIKEHHGTTYAYYFYRNQLDLMDGDKSKVCDNEFTYSGPKPHSKESAIIMISDSLEAASRTITDIDENKATELVNMIVNDKAESGQFDRCQLTFQELNIIKKSLVKSLASASHSRIKYSTKPSPNNPTYASNLI